MPNAVRRPFAGEGDVFAGAARHGVDRLQAHRGSPGQPTGLTCGFACGRERRETSLFYPGCFRNSGPDNGSDKGSDIAIPDMSARDGAPGG
ncbi:hypothetical protein [Streptomyces lydicus]|uniref:hypothetical protein n=1 Tax=Streptomyces lydicus TaxID=47763 RepID=UPI0037A98D7A